MVSIEALCGEKIDQLFSHRDFPDRKRLQFDSILGSFGLPYIGYTLKFQVVRIFCDPCSHSCRFLAQFLQFPFIHFFDPLLSSPSRIGSNILDTSAVFPVALSPSYRNFTTLGFLFSPLCSLTIHVKAFAETGFDRIQ